MSCECTDMDNDPIRMGLDPSHQMTESDIHEHQLPEKIGGKWKDHATVKKLVAALFRVELKNVADELMCMDTTQNGILNEIVSEIERHCNCNCNFRHIEDLKEENAALRTKVSELERVLAIQRQQEQDIKEQGLGNSIEAAAKLEDVSGATRNFDTDQEARERQIGIQLKNLDEKLKTEVTSLLQVPEVKEDKLKTAVKLDLLTKLSESLQHIYTNIQAMVAETCKCNEDLKREFYDFAYHGLRAEHNDLVLRVNDLESSQAEMSDEEEKAFKRLQQYQNNRQRQIHRLENVWRGLFTSPESLPEASSSYPTGGTNNSYKALSRNRTDPGTRQKQRKSREGANSSETPPKRDEEKYEVCMQIKKRPTLTRIFRSKGSKENLCHLVSYRAHRDS